MAVIPTHGAVDLRGSGGELRWNGYPIATLGSWARAKVRKDKKVGADVVVLTFAIAGWHPLYGAGERPLHPPSHIALRRQKPTPRKPWLKEIWRVYQLVECDTALGRAVFISNPHTGEETR